MVRMKMFRHQVLERILLHVKRTLFAWSRGLPKQVFRFARYVPPQEGGSLPLKRVRGVSLHAGLVFVCADGLRLPSRSSHYLRKTLRRGVEGLLEKHAGRLLLYVFLREQPVPHHRRRLRHRQ